MKKINNSVLRSAFAMILGFVLVLWPEAAVTYLVIAIGICFIIPGIFSLLNYFTREKVEVACSRKAYKVRLKPKKTAAVQAKPPKRPAKPKAAALPVPKPVAPRAPRVRLKKYLTDPTPLQRDVRELEGYNAKARERGKKELSYGYWAAEGKPAAPAW